MYQNSTLPILHHKRGEFIGHPLSGSFKLTPKNIHLIDGSSPPEPAMREAYEINSHLYIEEKSFYPRRVISFGSPAVKSMCNHVWRRRYYVHDARCQCASVHIDRFSPSWVEREMKTVPPPTILSKSPSIATGTVHVSTGSTSPGTGTITSPGDLVLSSPTIEIADLSKLGKNLTREIKEIARDELRKVLKEAFPDNFDDDSVRELMKNLGYDD